MIIGWDYWVMFDYFHILSQYGLDMGYYGSIEIDPAIGPIRDDFSAR